jgi:riboflavin kinase/FMN adenylyltransferase
MLIIDNKESLEKLEKDWALTIGNFDGVHLGHKQIIKTVAKACKDNAARGVAVMTFEPHPAVVLHPEKAPGLLTPLAMKKHLLKGLGVDCLIVLTDTLRLLNMSPGDFVDQFLMKTVRPSVVVEGPNFNFGYGRSGNIETLKTLAEQKGFKVVEVAPKELNIEGPTGRRRVLCSSSLVRRLLENGQVEQAGSVLSRFYRLMGRTVTGRGVGREIGFPTANIEPENQIIPAEGVYAGFVQVGENLEGVCEDLQQLPAAFSIGRAKTFVSEHPLLVEAHILEEKVADLSGKYLAMDFVKRIRGQRRFESRDKLAEQIAKDCENARGILARDVSNGGTRKT